MNLYRINKSLERLGFNWVLTLNTHHQRSPQQAEEQDAVEAIVPLIPLVLPLVGGVLMFLLAFIAIYMA